MPRNGGSLVDTVAGTVRDRNGVIYPLERLVVAGGRLYYARSIAPNPLFSYHERWLLPEQNWVVNRFAFHPHRLPSIDWYIETDLIEVDGALWRVSDGYLDVGLFEGRRYYLEDADELADGIAAGDIPLAEGLVALRALNQLCLALERHHYSGHALLREYAPGLPH